MLDFFPSYLLSSAVISGVNSGNITVYFTVEEAERAARQATTCKTSSGQPTWVFLSVSLSVHCPLQAAQAYMFDMNLFDFLQTLIGQDLTIHWIHVGMWMCRQLPFWSSKGAGHFMTLQPHWWFAEDGPKSHHEQTGWRRLKCNRNYNYHWLPLKSAAQWHGSTTPTAEEVHIHAITGHLVLTKGKKQNQKKEKKTVGH